MSNKTFNPEELSELGVAVHGARLAAEMVALDTAIRIANDAETVDEVLIRLQEEQDKRQEAVTAVLKRRAELKEKSGT